MENVRITRVWWCRDSSASQQHHDTRTVDVGTASTCAAGRAPVAADADGDADDDAECDYERRVE